MCAKQVDNRQASRFNEFLKETFGGRQCIQSYLKDRTFQQWNDNQEVQCNRVIPISAQEQALDKTRRFTGLLQRMDDARKGKAYFHDPSHKGDKGKGKGKGKEMRIADRWTKGLVAAGLDVGPYTDRRRGPEI